MDLVTITDHDSIDGCLELLDRFPDVENFVIGEEVSCRFPDGDIEVHLGVYGTTEALHRELQPLRGNVFDVIACLRAHDVFFTLNHLLHFYRGQAPLASYLRLALEVPALEVRNGAMLPEHNALIEQYASTWVGPLGIRRRQRRAYVTRIGRTWTEVPGATTAEQFMTGLRDGRGRTGGDHGSAPVIAIEIYGVVARYMASLAGFGPCTQPLPRRIGCLAFSTASLPFQFIPLVTALRIKSARTRRCGSNAARAGSSVRRQRRDAHGSD